MPRSAVIYTNLDVFARLKEAARRGFESAAIRPYTFSYPQRTDAHNVRVRLTELVDGAVARELAQLADRGEAILASPADRDVRSQSYEELMEDADRARTEATLQFVSPVIVETSGQNQPFPLLQAVFDRYIKVWDTFSGAKIGEVREWSTHVHVADFKISCVATPFGAGSQGWVRLEMGKGRTEEEIGLFNGMVDFAFYCGTGLHTDEGLGQTKRMEKKG